MRYRGKRRLVCQIQRFCKNDFAPGRKIDETLRWRTILSQISFFPPCAEGMVRRVRALIRRGPKNIYPRLFRCRRKKNGVFSPQGFFFLTLGWLFSSWMLFWGLVSSFCIEYFTSFENSIETVAVFLCLRTKQASNSSKRERKFPAGAKYE